MMLEEDKPEPQAAELPPPSPPPPLVLAEIIEVLMDEASRINSTQAALVKEGLLGAHDPKQKHKERCLVAAADMLARLEPYQKDIRALISRALMRGKTTNQRR